MVSVYHQTPIGIALITADDDHITSIYLPEGEFEITETKSPLLKIAIKQLDEYFEGKRTVFDLPVKQTGTAFQQTVWDELSKIAYGKTISYQQQARNMNNLPGIRAIASANGKNHLIIIVPCHRVIGSDGSLTGFGCGIWRKKWLLEHEAKVMGTGQTKLSF